MKKFEKHFKRMVSLDVIRIVALYCVISVHFFLNNEFYSQPIVGERMYVMVVMRTMFMVCVPLFIILTGFLMNKKQLSKKYYYGLGKTIGIYILASIACYGYCCLFQDVEFSFGTLIQGILNFTAAPYAWYIEMYIGLYLLIPFLNMIWNNVDIGGVTGKRCLILTLLLLTSAPSILNIWNFSIEGWWSQLSILNEYNEIIPHWWTGIYPITYYFLGCYLYEFKPKIKTSLNLLAFVGSVVVFGTFNYYRSYETNFIWGLWQEWGALPNTIITVLLFVLLLNLNYEKLSDNNKMLLAKLSNLCLGGYLVSWIFDQTFYPILNNAIVDMPLRLNYYFIIVPVIFFCSIGLSFVLNIIWSAIEKIQKIVYIKIC